MTTYKDAGVDIDAGTEAVARIKKHVRSTFSDNVLTDLGGFGGCFQFQKDQYEEPVLVSSSDGVGTKLKLAFISNRHDTIGQCLVNHCTNDILAVGARPLFFLDFFAAGKLDVVVFEEVVSGLSKACVENNCALIGGETAEMPGFYSEDEYDLCGTIIGVVDEKNLLSKRKVENGDILIGLPSTGLHTNGYSLARKVLLDKYDIDQYIPSIDSKLSESLLAVHKSYLPIMDEILTENWLVGLSHITGGGLIGNTKRIIDKNQTLDIDWNKWEWPSIFKFIQDSGNVPTDDMQNSFNLGIGMVMLVKKNYIEDAKKYLQSKNQEYHIIGKVV